MHDEVGRPPDAKSDIAYHDYLLLMVCMDSEWSRRCKDPSDFPPGANHEQFRNNCLKFGEGINRNYDAWRRANNDDSAPVYVDRYLYNPLSYFPLGHPDDACVVLLDDLDPAHHLTMRINRRIEDVSFGYCLDMAHLAEVARSGIGRTQSLFCEPDELFDPENGPTPPGDEGNSTGTCGTGAWVVHKMQRECPFLVFTRYRMDGLSSVTHLLLAQQAIYKTMASCIQETADRLRSFSTDARHLQEDWVAPADVDKTRVCVVDLKGAEEIGTLLFCNNLTVAMTIVAALRTLTYWHAFEHEPEFRTAMEQNDCVRLILEKATAERRADGQPRIKSILGNHLFRWTTSSILVAPHVVLEQDYGGCNGAVQAAINCQVSPGHRAHANEILSGGGHGGGGGSGEWDLFVAGEDDLVVPISCETGEPPQIETIQRPRSLVPVRTVLERWNYSMRECVRRRDRGPSFVGRDCVEIAIHLEVPVPPLLAVRKDQLPPNDGEHRPVLTDVLVEVQAKLCPPLPPTWADAEESEDKLPLNMKDLCFWQRQAGLPVKLRQTIESLYQTYFTVIADSHRFDLVLDLYDVFATLHRLITEVLPEKASRADEAISDTIPVLDARRVRRIETLVSAVENALHHRIAKVFPALSPLDMAIDFRGGLNQMILTAAAPMICSVGLFRRFVVEPELKSGKPKKGNTTAETADSRSTVGVVSWISLHSGMEYCPLDLGDQRLGEPQLAHYEVDVPHILHIPSYADYFHETGHLIFRNLFRQDAPADFRCPALEKLWRLSSSSRRKHQQRFECIKRRLDEVFAMFFGHVFVFGTDREVPLIHYATAFSRSLESIGWDDEQENAPVDAVVRFVEVAFQLSMVQMLLPKAGAEIPLDQWLNTKVTLLRDREALRAFAHIVELVGSYCPEFHGLWTTEPFQSACWEYAETIFLESYTSLKECLPWVFETVAEIYRRYSAAANVPREACGVTGNRVETEIDESLESGRPLLRCRLRVKEPEKSAEGTDGLPREPQDPFVDPLFVVAHVVDQYIHRIADFAGRRAILPRRPPKYEIVYSTQDEGDDRPWSEFQLDRARASLFCPVPQARRVRTRQEIAVRKTLRDVAATFHGRRLYRLVFDTLKSPSCTGSE